MYIDACTYCTHCTHTHRPRFTIYGLLMWTHCNTHCNTLQHATPYCKQIRYVSRMLCMCVYMCTNLMQHAATRCNALQRTATHCKPNSPCVTNAKRVCICVYSLTATCCNALQCTATYYKSQKNSSFVHVSRMLCVCVNMCIHSLQHTATHYNTLQRTANRFFICQECYACMYIECCYSCGKKAMHILCMHRMCVCI